MPQTRTVIVTGGAGFIGSALVRSLLADSNLRVVNVDKLTYSGNVESLGAQRADPNHIFVHGDIGDSALMRRLFEEHRPEGVFHLAAESHVDRSIDAPEDFIQTNIVGTFRLLTESHRYWTKSREDQPSFRFIHVSTDEVFGTLGELGAFNTSTPYDPSSPYSASKAASDHLVRAWGRTYGLPILVTNCSNNYGPYQFPEKLIPLMILSALEGRSLPVYGTGANVRDWLHVDDHVSALRLIFERGRLGETYLIGGNSERTNLHVVERICDLMDERLGRHGGESTRSLISFVKDRPGHDQRYAIDASKLTDDLGWLPTRTFEEGLSETVDWYLANREWCDRVRTGAYRLERLGLAGAA